MTELPDIIPESNEISLGFGWFALETHGGSAFRWARSGATLYVAATRPARYTVRMLVEPGPGTGSNPFALSVVDELERPLMHERIQGKERVSFDFVADEPALKRLRFVTTGGGAPVKNDPRILDFRAFEIGCSRGRTEVFPSTVRLGRGWHALEVFEGEAFRWVSNDAEIEIDPAAAASLDFFVEPGPGIGANSFTLQVLDADGAALASELIAGRQHVSIDLPRAQRRLRLRLRTDSGGRRVAGDERIMNFRVFRATAA